MFPKDFIFSVSTLLVVTSVAATGYASDGTVNFTGKLTVFTCRFGSVTPKAIGKVTPTVELPSVGVGLLSTVGATSSHTPFKILLRCSESRPGAVLAFFESSPGVDSVTGNVLNVGGTARGVQFQLLDAEGKVVKIGDSGQLRGVRADISVSEAQRAFGMSYAVQYYANADVVPGTAIGSVTYSINYQ